MSWQQKPTRAILAKTIDQRLAAIIRRHGGTSGPADSGYYLPAPPRGDCEGQLALGSDDD
jgi:hypothetical protein